MVGRYAIDVVADVVAVIAIVITIAAGAWRIGYLGYSDTRIALWHAKTHQ